MTRWWTAAAMVLLGACGTPGAGPADVPGTDADDEGPRPDQVVLAEVPEVDLPPDDPRCEPGPGRHVVDLVVAEDDWALLHRDVLADLEVPAMAWINGRPYPKSGLELHGGTARKFDKRSYRVTLDDPERVGFFDAPGDRQKHLVLQASWVDGTFLRNRLAFDLVREAGGLAPRVDFATVCVNHAWHGFYVVIERVDEEYLERQGLGADGNLYKAENHQADWRDKADPLAGYDREMGEDGDTEDLARLLDVLSGTPATLEAFRAEVEPALELRDFLAWQQAQTFAENRDCFTKNYLLYHDVEAEEGSPEARFRVVAWDSDATFGLNWDGQHAASDGTAWHGNDGFSPRLLGIAGYRGPYREAYLAALQGPWRGDALAARVDALAAAIRDRAREDLEAWGTGRDFDDEVAWLRDSVRRRAEVMTGVLEGLR